MHSLSLTVFISLLCITYFAVYSRKEHSGPEGIPQGLGSYGNCIVTEFYFHLNPKSHIDLDYGDAG